MQKYFLIVALTFSISAFTQSFDHVYKNLDAIKMIATYTIHSQQDSTNPSNIRNGKMLLFLSDSLSEFLNMALYMNDTITRKFTTFEQLQEYMLDTKRPMPASLYRIYKNYPKQKITYTEHIPSSTYKFEEELDLFQWKLTNDTITVCGFKAQMATCDFGGRSWIAWFSPDIPYSDGPYKFNGLPGLIVKVYDTRNHYVFELVSINKPAKGLMIDIEDKEYVVTTKQDFFSAQDSFREDIVNRAKEAGADNAMQQMAAKNMAERNNPIELIRK
ncbi:MAG: GLPGLI family protein [Lentimicrobiaceae bacterium]|jgi:GLPGLI family protein